MTMAGVHMGHGKLAMWEFDRTRASPDSDYLRAGIAALRTEEDALRIRREMMEQELFSQFLQRGMDEGKKDQEHDSSSRSMVRLDSSGEREDREGIPLS